MLHSWYWKWNQKCFHLPKRQKKDENVWIHGFCLIWSINQHKTKKYSTSCKLATLHHLLENVPPTQKWPWYIHLCRKCHLNFRALSSMFVYNFRFYQTVSWVLTKSYVLTELVSSFVLYCPMLYSKRPKRGYFVTIRVDL